MINWEDEAIILKVTAFGESAAVVNIFAKKNGKCAGQRTRRLKPTAILKNQNITF